jgi:hypothetical protein
MTSFLPPDEGDDDPPNRPTMLPSLNGLANEDLLDARLVREAQKLCDYFGQPESSDRALVCRLALLSANTMRMHEMPDVVDEFVVVGRHSESQLRLNDDGSLSLRHALVIPSAVSERSRAIDVIPLSPTVEIVEWSRVLPDALAGRCTAIQMGNSLLLMAAIGDKKTCMFRQLARPVAGRCGDTPDAQPLLAPAPEPDSDDDTPRLYSRVTLAHALVDHDYSTEPARVRRLRVLGFASHGWSAE